ncbi:hypothetical protein HF888_00970 [Bermanella marisrubri]|uniref:Uncharacterized protein n=1 Tax=Bermanella marisrubri TaxID=207949 RepID=Q1N481_9GAMM|nr:hypothetical protein [Bermanella marisrubri]EAT12984.1 hypothetical protein RED65_14847 [Oceanobacter sp. RED65] [Bermanella marisrubri]QIZ82889.1 hypothetical protein HF888_00970 [Bermanella marisrubri]
METDAPTFEIYLNVEIWNQDKTHCGFANKRTKLPFQPHCGMIIKTKLGEFCFPHVVWDMTTRVFEASSRVVAGWDEQQRFLDVQYYIDEFRRDSWNIIQPRERKWRD